MDEDSVEKKAFTTKYGLCQFKVTPFGLTNDDILIASATRDEHEQHVCLVVKRLREHQLVDKRLKCVFFQQEIRFLGHHITHNGIAISPDKGRCIQDWPTPRNAKQAQRFLGLCNDYRECVPRYAVVAKHLVDFASQPRKAWLLEQEESFNNLKRCLLEQEESFSNLKRCLLSAPLLLPPDWDFEDEYVLSTDASDFAILCSVAILRSILTMSPSRSPCFAALNRLLPETPVVRGPPRL